MGDGRRMHVGQAAAGQPGFERIQTVARSVKRIKPPSISHARANGQRLAARTSAKIHHHLAAVSIQQQGQQLRAFVLNLDRATGKNLDLGERRLGVQPQPPW